MQIYDQLKVKTSDLITILGRPTKGIFMIVEGSARVMSEKGDEILANLSEGDFFGEISLLFDIPCTARVQADPMYYFLLISKTLSISINLCLITESFQSIS